MDTNTSTVPPEHYTPQTYEFMARGIPPIGGKRGLKLLQNASVATHTKPVKVCDIHKTRQSSRHTHVKTYDTGVTTPGRLAVMRNHHWIFQYKKTQSLLLSPGKIYSKCRDFS